MTFPDRRMNSLLNKSPESGYIHSRNGASDSQHLCTMKEEIFKQKKKKAIRGYKSKRQQQYQHWRGGKGSSVARVHLSQGMSTFRRAPLMSKSNPNLSEQGHVRISNLSPRPCTENSNRSMIGSLSKGPQLSLGTRVNLPSSHHLGETVDPRKKTIPFQTKAQDSCQHKKLFRL